ncbi:MAG: serine/threonine protein kinase with repeat, partial [Acidobacteria bacterium]|nr:serine/threonine protein kinase with repeat [Acidobacteriota bacterium]
MIGKTLGHYQVLEKIGQGGMGEVYLANDTSLQRKVALKFLPPEMQQDPAAHQRFMHEAKSAAALDHPYICHINEVSEAEGKHFIVMEYVEGQTLKERLAQEALPFSVTKQIATEILEALEKAHEKGIVHRDLKPANIMLTREGHAKVMDFGLAKQVHPAAGTSESREETLSAVTQSGSISGTLAYMSPEQMQGKQVDARSDLFSFGIVLYEMLTGVHPFGRPSAMETASAILTDTPPPLDRYKSGIPSQLQDILKKLLLKNPVQRYQSAREVQADFGRITLNGPPDSRASRNIRWVWVAAALIILVLGIVPVSWWVRDSYFKSPQVALAFQESDWILIAEVENLTGDPVFDRSLQTAMIIGIQQSKYVNVFPPARVQETLERMRKEKGVKLDEALACDIAAREGVKAVLASSISNAGGVYSLSVRLVEPSRRAIVLSETADAHGRDQVLAVLDSLVKSIRQNLGESLSSMSSQGLPLPKASTASIEALKIYSDGVRLKASSETSGYELILQAVSMDPDFALAHADLGLACYRGAIDGGRVEGEKHFTKALSLIDRLTLRERLWIRAVIEDCRGNAPYAAECYKAFLAQYPDDRDGWLRLGWLYMARQGQYEKSIQALQKALEIDPANSTAYVNIATCYGGLAKWEEARKNYEKGFELSPSDLLGYNVNPQYGFTLVRLGDLQKAAETFQKMIGADEVPKRARGFRSMGLLAMYQGKLSDAIADFKRAVMINKTENVSDSEFRDHLFLASAYQLKGRKTEFIEELATADRLLSKEHFEPGFISELATMYARIGRTREASRLLDEMSSQAKNLTALSALNRTDLGDKANISEVQGEIALAKGRVGEAIECFELSRNLESRYPKEPLARAFRKLGKLQDAAHMYKEIIAQYSLSGVLLQHWILAHYELAKIYSEMGDLQNAKEYYGKFLGIWKDADPDIPILKQAKVE